MGYGEVSEPAIVVRMLCTRCNKVPPTEHRKRCGPCREKENSRKRRFKKRRREQSVPTGLKRCTNCYKNKLRDQYINTHVRKTSLTAWCRTCRDSSNRSSMKPTTAKGICLKVWKDWQLEHPCPCGETRAIEAPGARHPCGHTRWWSNHGGETALRHELVKLRPLCRWCNRLRKRPLLRCARTRRRYNVVIEEKLRRGMCMTCAKPVTRENAAAFDFDHREPVHKKHSVSDMVRMPDHQFKSLYPLEVAKCDLLCCMCHYEKTHYNPNNGVSQ